MKELEGLLALVLAAILLAAAARRVGAPYPVFLALGASSSCLFRARLRSPSRPNWRSRCSSHRAARCRLRHLTERSSSHSEIHGAALHAARQAVVGPAVTGRTGKRDEEGRYDRCSSRSWHWRCDLLHSPDGLERLLDDRQIEHLCKTIRQASWHSVQSNLTLPC
jgi:hypothetical protein